MVDFPTPGTYRIKSTNYGCYAGIRSFQGRDMLCGVRETDNKWELAYVVDSTRDQPDQPICILVEVDPDGEPYGYLGVEDIRNDVSVHRMKDQKVWRLKKTDKGIVIYQVADDVPYAWYLCQWEEGDQVTIVDDEASADGEVVFQSWEFVPTKSDQ